MVISRLRKDSPALCRPAAVKVKARPGGSVSVSVTNPMQGHQLWLGNTCILGGGVAPWDSCKFLGVCPVFWEAVWRWREEKCPGEKQET